MRKKYLINIKFVKRIIIFLFIVFNIFVTSCNLPEKLFPTITEEEVKEVMKICDNLEPPPFFGKGDKFDVIREGAAVRSINYSSLAEPAQVKEYYVNLLTKSGWSYYPAQHTLEDHILFKKDKYAIKIEYTPIAITSKRIYGVSCSIGLH